MQSQNLTTLRNRMRQQNVAALHVPRQDMFQGEYVAACDERLAWVSGFTGSAGFALITLDAAHLFVDGRYTLQAQLQAKDFTIHPLSPRAIDAVCQNLKALHYDPWLVSAQQLLAWAERTEMLALQANPIDLLWQNRPVALLSPAYDYALAYTGVERGQKLAELRQDMGRANIQAWLLSNPESVCWLLNIRGADLPYVPVLHCMALVTPTEVSLFCEPSKISQPLQQMLGVQVIPFTKMPETLKAVHCEITADRRSTPSALLTSKNLTNWQTDVCELQKAKKNAVEQAGMIMCHIRDAVAVLRFWQWLECQNSATEIAAQDYLGVCRSQVDLYQGDSFATISGYGAHGAIVHYRVTPETDVVIGDGFYLLDSGGQYLDGTTDITRVFCKGVPTQQQRVHYTLVLRGHIALAKVRFPIGTTGAQLDALARQHLWGQGLDYAHGTGHGVGSFLNVHEGPQGISKARHVALEPGMVVSNEPGLYLQGEYGIRLENLQMVQPSIFDGFLEFNQLTLVPYAKELIEWTMLELDELAWLQQYYQEIWALIAHRLSADEQAWLKVKLAFTTH